MTKSQSNERRRDRGKSFKNYFRSFFIIVLIGFESVLSLLKSL